jgi:hypothetical protein
MSQQLLEILLPARARLRDEDVYIELENGVRQLNISLSDRKKIMVIAMELFLNMKEHGFTERLSLLRIHDVAGKDFQISSLNFASPAETLRLSGKYNQLTRVGDYRKNFRDKLAAKNFTDEPAGNLGLDICFRNSTRNNLRLYPVSDELNLVFLSFSLHNHGKSAA